MSDSYADILFEVESGTAWITINREDKGNKFRPETCIELADALRRVRSDASIRVAVLTGAGDKFFCIGGEHDPARLLDYSEVMPIIDVYSLIDSIAKPIIAAVNGFAVGGGQVLHTVCDLTIAAEHAVFRQVGPMVGSFDAGYGTWYLEDAIGRKRAKEMWYLNKKYSAAEALQMGLVNEVVPGDQLHDRVAQVAADLQQRGPVAIAALKGAFSARHTGVLGQARIAHDQMLPFYSRTSEAHEVSEAFNERRSPDPAKFLT